MGDVEPSTPRSDQQPPAWPGVALLCFVTVVAYGAVWTRGVQGDDLCMCELAASHGYWGGVQRWLDNWNGRLFHAVAEIGVYHLHWFADPLRAPWYLVHTGSVLAHILFCSIFLRLLMRAGIAMGAALPAVLVFAIHPITAEPVLWLAESFGYVFGNLMVILAVWTYLEYEQKKRTGWLALTILLSISVTLSIEQYLPILCMLALVYYLRSRWQRNCGSSWIPLSVALLCVLVFLALHFGAFEGTGARLSRVIDQPSAPTHDPGLLWKLAWWLILFPGSGYFSGALGWGWNMLLHDWRLIAIVAVAVLAASLTITAPLSWRAPSHVSLRESHLWLTISGILVFVGSLVPFVVTGKYGIASRNMYPALPGLLVVAAVALNILAMQVSLRRLFIAVLVPTIAAFVALSLTANIGMQAMFASSWGLHRNIIEVIQQNADQIRQSKALELTGIPAVPYKSISMLDYGWAFPCLVRWVVGSNEVKAWNNLMSIEKRPSGSESVHRIHLLPRDQ